MPDVNFSTGGNQVPQADLAKPTAIKSFVVLSPEGFCSSEGGFLEKSPFQVQFGPPGWEW